MARTVLLVTMFSFQLWVNNWLSVIQRGCRPCRIEDLANRDDLFPVVKIVLGVRVVVVAIGRHVLVNYLVLADSSRCNSVTINIVDLSCIDLGHFFTFICLLLLCFFLPGGCFLLSLSFSFLSSLCSCCLTCLSVCLLLVWLLIAWLFLVWLFLLWLFGFNLRIDDLTCGVADCSA